MTTQRTAAVAGNPIPLIESQWPFLVVPDDHIDRRWFPDGIRLDAWQLDIIGCICSDTGPVEINIKGCTGAGKGAAVSMGVCLYFWLHMDARVIVTSDTADHAKDVMFREIRKWLNKMAVPPPGTNSKSGADAGAERYIKIANPQTDEGFSGHHSDHVMFVIDEATSLPGNRYNLTKTQSHKTVALANPRTMAGWFRRSFGKSQPDITHTVDTAMGGRRLFTASGLDCTNVKAKRKLIRGQIGIQRFTELMTNPDQRFGRVFGLAKFPDEDPELQLIMPTWLERHMVPRRQRVDVHAFGLDVGASEHGDATVLASGGGEGCERLHVWNEPDTMRTVGKVISIAREYYQIDLASSAAPVVVDMDGLGKGVGDRLAELGVNVIVFNGNATPRHPKRYKNKRAEGHGELAARLDPAGAWPDVPWFLPVDDELEEELVAPERVYGSDGLQFGITPKRRTVGSAYKGETLAERLGRSPNKSDAVVYLYHAIARDPDMAQPVVMESVMGPGIY